MPFAFCLARLPIGGKPVLLALAALPLVLPSFVSAYALVLLFGRSGIVTGALQRARHPVRLDLRREGHRHRLHADALSLRRAAGHRRRSSRSTSRSRRRRKISAPRAARMLRTVTLPLVLPSILAGGLLVFIEALENFGVPFVLAEDRPILAVEAYKLFVGETTDNPASAGVLGVLLIVCTIVALLVQRAVLARRHYATGARRSAAAARGEPGAAPPRRRLLLDRGRRRAGAVRRRGGDLVHEVQRAGAACRLLDSTISRSCSSAPTGRSPIRCCSRALAALRRDPDRRADRLCRGAPPLAPLGAARYRRHVAVRGRRHGARHRPGDGLSTAASWS